MTPLEALHQHQHICDELYDLALQENHFLQKNQRTPDAALLERKKALIGKLDAALEALRQAPKGEVRDPSVKSALDKTRSRILQILQLDKENEQLLLRFSLSRGSAPAAGPTVPSSMLQKIYSKHA